MAMDHFDLHAIMQIYEKSLQHPDLAAIRQWALSELRAHNAQMAAEQAKAAAPAPVVINESGAVEDEASDSEDEE